MFGIKHLRAGKHVRARHTEGFPRHRNSRLTGVLASLARGATIVALAILLQPKLLHPAADPSTLNARMSEAFANYVRGTEARNNSELQRDSDLLWIDALPQAARKQAYAALAQGEVQLEQRGKSEAGGGIRCPDCLIHHWEGLIFIPGAKLDDVLRILEDYNHHAEYYAPDVVDSRIESRAGDHFRVFLRFRRKKVIAAVLNTEHDVHYFRDAASRAHSRSSATHIAEVENPGKANEREKPREDDSGFMWGMETWWRMQEKDKGVYVQSEVVSLTRSIPTGLGWMIGPFVTAVPKESLTFTLEATRKAVLAHLAAQTAN
jgi:hypothetical protein